MKAMNVCLQTADQHVDLRNHGVVQLFTKPHPRRKTPRLLATVQVFRPPSHHNTHPLHLLFTPQSHLPIFYPIPLPNPLYLAIST